jgi:NAD(P)-dependent dehydrogenase (short-subunit alcohol dehydrogenase family)
LAAIEDIYVHIYIPGIGRFGVIEDIYVYVYISGIGRFGAIEDICVYMYIPGIGRFGAIEDMSEADFTSSFDVNVKGVWLWAREVLPAMKRQVYI